MTEAQPTPRVFSNCIFGTAGDGISCPYQYGWARDIDPYYHAWLNEQLYDSWVRSMDALNWAPFIARLPQTRPEPTRELPPPDQPREENAHYYTTNVSTLCTPEEAMNALLSPNMSAPGAPQAHDGVEPRLELWHLWSPNPIRQVVNVQAGSILNIALEGHEFQGTVLTNVTPGGLGSNIRVTGTGNGPEAWWKRAWNDSVGWTLFTARNLLLAQGCNTLHGVAPYAE